LSSEKRVYIFYRPEIDDLRARLGFVFGYPHLGLFSRQVIIEEILRF
jgi:hypothetical protein